MKNAFRSCRPNLFCRRASSLSIDIGRNDLGALLREQQCNAFSNSHRRPTYERYAAFQAHGSPLYYKGEVTETITQYDPCSTNDGLRNLDDPFPSVFD